MKTLKEIGLETSGHSKCDDCEQEDYLPIYDKWWSSFRNDPIKILEIGIGQKGSLRMWREYFSNGIIYGADIDPQKLFEEERIETFILDQSNQKSCDNIGKAIGPFDIIIDDGGHQMYQQIHSLYYMFPYVKNKGMYIVEDTCTSYWPHFQGGYGKEQTTMNFLKLLTDEPNTMFIGMGNYGGQLNSCPTPNFPVKNIESLHFYQSVVIIKKK